MPQTPLDVHWAVGIPGWEEEQQGPVKASKRRAHGLSSGWRGATQPPGSSASSCGHWGTPPWACRLLQGRGSLHDANRPHSGPLFLCIQGLRRQDGEQTRDIDAQKQPI